MDLGAILVALVIALVVKIAVMGLGAYVLLRLFGSAYGRPGRRLWLLLPLENLPEIRILWWSLALFMVAELTCGVEVYIIFRSSPIMSGIHSFTSGLGMGLFGLGVFLYLEKNLIRYGEPACVVNRICRGCTIRADGGCKFRIVILLAVTFVALSTAPAFLTSTERMTTDMRKYILPFESLNTWFDEDVEPWILRHYPDYEPSGEAYYLPESMLVIEFRILPAVVLLLSLAALYWIRTCRELRGMRVAAFACGAIAYTYLEIVIYPAIDDVLIGSLGHEVVELWFLLITAEFLRRCFPRDVPGAVPPPGSAEASP